MRQLGAKGPLFVPLCHPSTRAWIGLRLANRTEADERDNETNLSTL